MSEKQVQIKVDLRDYLAAKALPILLENCFLEELHDCDPGGWMDGIAYDAYRMADAMLRAREEK
jgi:hypothetical protein